MQIKCIRWRIWKKGHNNGTQRNIYFTKRHRKTLKWESEFFSTFSFICHNLHNWLEETSKGTTQLFLWTITKHLIRNSHLKKNIFLNVWTLLLPQMLTRPVMVFQKSSHIPLSSSLIIQLRPKSSNCDESLSALKFLENHKVCLCFLEFLLSLTAKSFSHYIMS